MENIQVVIKGEGTFSLKRGENVLSVLSEEKRAAISGCAGNGSCGKCAVRFIMGAPLPTATDRKMFSPSALREGYRLACLAKPTQNCILEFCFSQQEIEIVDVAFSKDNIHSLGAQIDSRVVVSVSPDAYGPVMVVVDLGTTTIVMQLIEIETGKVIDTYKTMNPQRRFGADVMTRMTQALKGDDILLSECVQYCLNGMIDKWLYAGFCPELVAVSCNTCMTYLYNRFDVTELSKAPYNATKLDKVETEIAHIPTVFLPGLSAFVGGDITAGLLACNAKREEEKTPEGIYMLIDLGTNGEIALVKGEEIFVTATSAGPAFEGGANANTPGTDMVRIISLLLSKGMIDETGLFADAEDPLLHSGVVVDGVLIRQEDVRSIQVAKAAVYAGIQILCEKAQITPEQIEKVYLAGGFGYFLDVDSACNIGLLPEQLREKTTAVGNTSLSGGLAYGLAYRKDPGADPAEEIKRRTKSINLAREDGFEKRYIDAINLTGRRS
ncbi:MAG: ASKHA domain-containing protein [Lachnospiraceae bacterium]|nr:ASKHA domain-containing protein [Lachnospiraceae bacterium]